MKNFLIWLLKKFPEHESGPTSSVDHGSYYVATAHWVPLLGWWTVLEIYENVLAKKLVQSQIMRAKFRSIKTKR